MSESNSNPTKKTPGKKAPAKKAGPKNTQTEAPVEPSSVSEWKTPNPPLPLPSGKAMKIRRSGFQTWMKVGLVPNSLMGVMQSALDKGDSPENLGDLLDDPGSLKDMMEMIDKITIFSAIDPEVHPEPESEADRDDDLLYVDEVDDEDKMFIFNFLTSGVRDVETFRNEQAAMLESLPGR